MAAPCLFTALRFLSSARISETKIMMLLMKVGAYEGQLRDFKFAEAQVLLKRKWAVLPEVEKPKVDAQESSSE